IQPSPPLSVFERCFAQFFLISQAHARGKSGNACMRAMPTTPHLLDELRRYPFAEQVIRNAPASGGAYVLWEDHEVTLVGSTASIRARLLEYLQGTRHCACSP